MDSTGATLIALPYLLPVGYGSTDHAANNNQARSSMLLLLLYVASLHAVHASSRDLNTDSCATAATNDISKLLKRG